MAENFAEHNESEGQGVRFLLLETYNRVGRRQVSSQVLGAFWLVYAIMSAMKREAFEQLVAVALDELPEEIQQALDNVDVVIQDWADRTTLRRAGVSDPTQLMGFYHGVPQTKRTMGYNLVLPDKISIFRRPIEMRSRSHADVRALVKRVVRHEIAHHFGIDDERLRQIGAY